MQVRFIIKKKKTDSKALALLGTNQSAVCWSFILDNVKCLHLQIIESIFFDIAK